MSALIAEQRVELRCIESRLRASESKAEAMESRLRVSESKAEAMESRLKTSESKAEAMESRLRVSEKTMEEQRAVMKELQEKQEQQAAALGAVGGSLNLTGSQVEKLRRETEEGRVSFSASLVSSGDVTIGPFTTDLPTLVYKHVFSNVGNAYNPHTGIFSAPVRVVYHFVFFVFGNGHASTNTAVSLNKNGEHIALAHAHQPSHQMTPSNGVSLLLEVGDVVYLKVWHNSWSGRRPLAQRGDQVKQRAKRSRLGLQNGGLKAQHQPPPSKPDIHTVLREMSVLIAEQRVELRCMESRLRASESKAEAMETRLRVSESKAEAMETRLRVSEKTMEEQRAVMKELQKKQKQQAAAVGAVGGSLNLTGSQVEELRREREEGRVSSSASLVSSGDVTIGPFTTDLPTPVYKHIFSNVGNAYNPHTDVVYLKLGYNSWVRDSLNHHSTFSGHLLFLL
ncbi:hypothetical protein ACEWY4_020394 [Coilia grayii]|uniref:C1q domain-containing protein n=1 Tax=Coilia grayii TaxID=363190 RepID=A0ABD1JFN4_9TELE